MHPRTFKGWRDAGAYTLLLLLAVAAHGETLEISPQSPDATQKITIRVTGVWSDSCYPKEPRVTFEGTTVRLGLRVVDHICTPSLTPYSHEVTIGPLQAGTYVVAAFHDRNDLSRALAQTPLVVRSADPPFLVLPHALPKTIGGTVLLRGQRIAFCESDVPNCDSREVTIGSRVIRLTNVSDFNRDLEVIVPPQDAELVDVTIRYPDGSTATARNALRFFDPAAPPDPSLFTRILLPITRDARGAFGSDFRVSLSAYNSQRYSIPLWRGGFLQTGTTSPLAPAEPNGSIVMPLRRESEAIHFGSNVRDVSRVEQTFGSEMRVVREEDARVLESDLPDIPNDPNFRLNLRLYGIDSIDGTMQVSLHSLDNRVLIGDTTVDLSTSAHCTATPCATQEPAFGNISDLRTAFVGLQLTTEPRFRIHITGPPGYRYWALLTVTNNTTQQITTVTPQ